MYQVWDDGKLIDVDERLALSQQRAGKCRIRRWSRNPDDGVAAIPRPEEITMDETRTYTHNGSTHPISYPHLSDVAMAGYVRTLMGHDLDHEAVVVGARDRILHLSQRKVHILSIVHRHGTNLTAHATRAGARKELHKYVAECWDELWLKGSMPADQDEAIEAYFDRARDIGEEEYTLDEVDVQSETA